MLLPDVTVPDAVVIWLMTNDTEAPIGLKMKPPAVACPALNAVTAVPPVVTVETSNATSVVSPCFVGIGFVTPTGPPLTRGAH